MQGFHWLQGSGSRVRNDRSKNAGRRIRSGTTRLTVEALEDRRVLTFAAAVPYAVGINPQAVAVGDFNNDGIGDIATANSGSGTVSVLSGKAGNDAGTFQPAVNLAADTGTHGLAVGDLDKDGLPDIVTANQFSL